MAQSNISMSASQIRVCARVKSTWWSGGANLMLTGIRRRNALSKSIGRLVAPNTTTGASEVEDNPSHSARNAPRGCQGVLEGVV